MAEFTSLATDIANPVTHTALDFFEKPNVLVNYESGFDQEIYPQVGSRGPTLDFLISGDQRNCLDLNYIQLGLQVAIYTAEGKDRVKINDASKVVFANNTLHSLFSQVEVYANGILISDSNNSYHHRAFLETELTTNSDSKETWAACQGYCYDPEPSSDANKSEWLQKRMKSTLEAEYVSSLYGSLYVDFFSCEKLMIPEVDIRIKLYRASNEFSLISLGDDADQLFTAVIEKSSLFVRKITVTESVRLSIERALLKAPARYPYIESLCKSFIMQSGQNSCQRVHIWYGTHQATNIVHGGKRQVQRFKELKSFFVQ